MEDKGREGMILLITLLSFAANVLIAGCIDGGWGGGAGYYCCRYEERHTGCGGKGWSDWERASVSFNIGDYKEGWTPEKVCDKYTGSDTRCDGGCCIYIQYRNNRLSAGSCS